ncbi:hypothetical protein J4214_04445 [Candidatus Woesearchaeota archaeon]|nr:hypothetical protein [Candidatus Woesearchaeota archaeon]
MPENITVLNRRTALRRLKNIGIAALSSGLVLGSLYFEVPLIKFSINKYENWNAYFYVEHAIESGSYSQSNKFLFESKNKLTTEQISELENMINAIHPDSLFYKAQRVSDEEEIELLRIAHQEYSLIGKQNQELKEQYFIAYMNVLISEITVPSSIIRRRVDEYELKTKFDKLLDDKIIFEDNTFTPKMRIASDQLLIHVAKNIEISSADFDKTYPLIISILSLTEKLDLEQTYREKILESYAKLIKNFLERENLYDSTKVKYLASLKKLEIRYNYKVSSLDVQSEFIDYSLKL